MKKFDLPLWADTLFVFSVLSIIFLVFFRFSMHLALSIVCSLLVGISGSTLFFFFYKRHRSKKHYSRQEKENMEKLAFHLAITTPEENMELLLEGLQKNADKMQKESPILENDCIVYDGKRYICKFIFEKITADMLSPYIRGEIDKLIFIALDYTPEAKKLANSFNVKILDLVKFYDFLKQNDAIPQEFVQPLNKKRKFLENVGLHFSRKAAKGYLFSGCFLLLFSLITIFPLYYIIFGSILLGIAVFLRFFGKKES